MLISLIRGPTPFSVLQFAWTIISGHGEQSGVVHLESRLAAEGT